MILLLLNNNRFVISIIGVKISLFNDYFWKIFTNKNVSEFTTMKLTDVKLYSVIATSQNLDIREPIQCDLYVYTGF